MRKNKNCTIAYKLERINSFLFQENIQNVLGGSDVVNTAKDTLLYKDNMCSQDIERDKYCGNCSVAV
jgi:hypothetical protein